MESQAYQTYHRDECVTFLRTAERFGGLSNMAGGYPLSINRIRILTSEALYQACRFPHLPEIQRLIIGQTSPMAAKMKCKPYRKESREDWDTVRIQIMRWCLQVKLVQHWEKFGELLLSTGNKPIVEVSYRDSFWGSKPIDAKLLSGMNILGRLLVELREKLWDPETHGLWIVTPPSLSQFLLLNEQIGLIEIAKPKLRAVFQKVQKEIGTPEHLIADSKVHRVVEDHTDFRQVEIEQQEPDIGMLLSDLLQPDTTIVQCVLPLDELNGKDVVKKPKSKSHRKGK